MLPYFLKAEHNERGADAFHGRGGPLNVMDLRSPNRFCPAFIDAAQQAGFAANRDFNGATQEGVGLYQVTQKDGERFSAAKAYLTPNLGRPNLHVLTDAHDDAHRARRPARHRRRGARRRRRRGHCRRAARCCSAPARCSRRSC